MKNGHQVDIYFSTSHSRRFNVDIYPAIGKVEFLRKFYVEKYLRGHGIFFNVESTSTLRRKVSVQTWYIFQRRFNDEISLHEHCRFINVEYKSIPRRCFPHGIRRFFDVEYVRDVEARGIPLFIITAHVRDYQIIILYNLL